MTEEIAPYGKQLPDRVGQNWNRVRSLVEFMTGVVVSSKDDFKLSVGHALQSALKHQFLETLMDEFDSYRKKGRIKDSDLKTKQGQACFMEMLNFLDEDNPDDIRFQFMKKLYLGIMSDDERDRESVVEQQYISLCRCLTSGEMLVLIGAWKFSEEGQNTNPHSEEAWFGEVAKMSGLNHRSLCQYHGRGLDEKGFIQHKDQFNSKVIHGLSGLAIGVLTYIDRYDENQSSSK